MSDEEEKKPYTLAVFEWIDKTDLEPHEQITAEELCERYGVPRSFVVERVEKRVQQAASCQSLPFTILLVASYAAVAITHIDAEKVRAVEYSVSFDIEDNANFAYDSPFIGHKNLHDVNSFPDFWSFMNKGLIPLLFVQERMWGEELILLNRTTDAGIAPVQVLPRNAWGMMTNYNRIVGGVRMRTERASNVTCTQSAALNEFYGIRCLGGQLRDYSLDPDVDKRRDTSQADKDRDQWLWVHKTVGEIQLEMLDLELDGWLDSLVEKVEIAIPIYNAEFSVHTMVCVNFYFSRGGHIWKHIVTQSCYANWYTRWYHYMNDALYVSCVMYLFASEGWDIITTLWHNKFRCGPFVDEYFSIWNIIDWISIICGIVLMVFFWVCFENTRKLNEAAEAVAALRPISGDAGELVEVQDYMDILETAVNWVTFLQRMLARYPLIIVFRLFKAFHAQPRLALVTMTMYESTEDLLHFLWFSSASCWAS
jgi:hypothetical protein